MKKLLLLILLSQSVWAQTINGRVVDQKGEPLPFVNIVANNGLKGTTTNLDGYFSFSGSSEITQLRFSYIGFKPLTLRGNEIQENLQVTLQEEAEMLNEATVFPGENPAHRIIRNASENRDLNNPEKLESFVYKTYSKFWVTFNKDSIDTSIDTLRLSDLLEDRGQTDSAKALNPESDTIVRIDSSGYNLHRTLSEQYLFFMETATERKYGAGRDNETVLAQRTSGFKNPMFALLITQLQSFSFYNNYIGISGDEYLNPISPGSTSRYFFILEDTIVKNPGDTTYVISFRPRPNKGFRPLVGAISINSTDWAIENVRAKPAEASGINIEIRQEYQRFGPHVWFPVAFKADITINMIQARDAGPALAVMRRHLSDIQINVPLKRKDVPRNKLVIENKASKNADEVLAKMRPVELDSMELRSYKVIDSISEEENLEQNLSILLALSRGYVPLGKVNLDINNLLNYNTYEGVRLGLGMETNDKFSEWLRLGGYYAYGFKDQVHKYGINAKATLNKNLRFAVIGGYRFDLFETGGFDIPGVEKKGLFQDNYQQLYIEQWDESNRWYGGLQIDPLPTVAYELRLRHERRNTIGNYRFRYREGGELNFGNQFYYSEIINTLRFAPEEEYAETPFGKIRIKGGYPVVYLSYTRGLSNILNGDFSYNKFQLRGDYRHRTVRFGETILSLQGGVVLEDMPYQKNFVGTANAISTNNFWQRNLALADRTSFETMRINEFLSDTYVQFMWRQDFKALLFSRENFKPHLELVNRVAFGSLRSPGLHSGLPFKTLESGFFETGIECNRLYSMNFLGFGLGFYYRYGPNSLNQFTDNIAIKITSKFGL